MFSRTFFNVCKMSCESFGKNVKSSGSSELVRRLSDSKSWRSDPGQVCYENAIKTLNTVQNGDPTSHIRRKQCEHFQKAEWFAAAGKVPVEKLDKLAAIHVSGTKGKGSVCAYCESILRSSGYKTGFYSSPHLVEVRERIRINGKPISKELFTAYFWEFWNNYKETEKPSYGTFLALMSFHIFLKEKVDVAIVEVGHGGEYDGTNIIRKPVVCGVTLLEKDHLKSLGGSVESIAWHKAGIFKLGVPAFTVPQNPVSMKVLAQRARERQTTLKVVPEMSTFLGKDGTALGIEGKHQYQNASLAVHMCRSWLEYRERLGKHEESSVENSSVPIEGSSSPPTAEVFSIPDSFKEGLAKTYWPGRTQCVERTNLTFYLDGAHTKHSIEACSSWFYDKSNEEIIRKRPKLISRVLIVNFKGNRDAKTLLEPLVKCNFDYVVFCPNLLSEEPLAMTSDISDFTKIPEFQKQKCYKIQETWKEIIRGHNLSADSVAMPKIQTLEHNSRVFGCVTDAVHWVVNDRNASITSRKATLPDVISRADHVQILVTGSLFLVGMVMKVLGPEIVEM